MAKESMTSKIAQTNFYLEVPLSKVQPHKVVEIMVEESITNKTARTNFNLKVPLSEVQPHEAIEIMVEESMTTKTMQINSALEVPRSQVQPQRIPMNPKLLKATRSGDKGILDELLRSEDVSSRASMGEIAITVPEDAATQKDARCFLGVTLEGNTALHIVASRGNLELAKEICRRERSLLTAPNTRLDTPLHCAARVGDDKMVSLIIQFAKEDEIEARRVLMARNWDEANALHEAAKYDHVRVAEILMAEDAQLASMLNNAKMSPLFLAIVTGSFNVAKALLRSPSWEKASPASYVGTDKRTALHVAVFMNQEITEDILKREPTLTKTADDLGRLPLHYIASNGHRDMAKLLLEYDPSTAYLSDADGFFPIHVAAIMDNIPVIDQILNQCPDTDELLDGTGKNFLHVAFQRRKLDTVKKIISKRPDLRKLLNDQDNMGNTPLHTAVINGDQWSVHFLLRDETVYVNVINHDGFTPLDLACAKQDKVPQLRMSPEVSIATCLALIKAPFGPRELHYVGKDELSSNTTQGKPSGNDAFEISHQKEDDKFKEKSSSNAGNQIKRQMNLARNLGLAAALIATVTFAAGFTLPGGYISDNQADRGTAVLANEYTFKVFLISDTFALVCSIMATCWLMYAGTSEVDRYTRIRALFWAMRGLWVAFAGMSSAFAMAIYVVLAPRRRNISILFCIIVLGAPLLAYMVAYYNLYSLLKTVTIRQGYRQCIWLAKHPHDEKRLGHKPWPRRHRIVLPLLTMGAYAIFFLLAML